uniref:Uncharacterized protein n=1 Tax=Siphoviridae sp. ctETQ12 TaxID=2826206 RepID=A0A8S5M6Z8_9CAUD|nr:MAG TPA: hypothetical protein [Siphoviridae sp. ctETQ12]DAM52288.1 MAG TPA: hypothetical protein [Bacteriophage sp.]
MARMLRLPDGPGNLTIDRHQLTHRQPIHVQQLPTDVREDMETIRIATIGHPAKHVKRVAGGLRLQIRHETPPVVD